MSICIPAHDDARWVSDAVRSACAQDHAVLEILVLDNASTDDTFAVAGRAAAGDTRVRLRRHAQDIGMARNFSACVAEARGELVLVLCADDTLEPGAAATLAAALERQPGAVLAAGGRLLSDEQLRPIRLLRARRRATQVAGDDLARECFAWGNRIGEPSAVMFRREAALRGFNDAYSQLVDLEMWLHLLSAGSAILLPQALCRVRRHEAQLTAANIRSARVMEDKLRFFRQFAPVLAPRMSPLQKLAWDARMASSAERIAQAGGTVPAPALEAVFYPAAFRPLVVPAASAAWRLLLSLRPRQSRW